MISQFYGDVECTGRVIFLDIPTDDVVGGHTERKEVKMLPTIFRFIDTRFIIHPGLGCNENTSVSFADQHRPNAFR